MTNDRILEIWKEAERRLNEWLKYSTFNEMSVCDSRMRFDMSLGLFGGYPFEEPKWMKNKSFDNFITESEFNSREYGNIIDQLYEKASEK